MATDYEALISKLKAIALLKGFAVCGVSDGVVVVYTAEKLRAMAEQAESNPDKTLINVVITSNKSQTPVGLA